jgi:hypothetical protein
MQKATAVVVMAFLLLLVVPPSWGQQQKAAAPPPVQCLDCSPHPGNLVPPASVSVAVAQVAQSKFVTLQNHIVASTVTSADLSAAASALESMFANDNETGFTAAMQTYYLANSALFETNPTQAQINTAYAWVQQNGGKLTLTQFQSAFTSSTLSDRQAFFSAVQTHGLEWVFSQFVTMLQQTVARLQKNGNGGSLVFADCPNAGFDLRVGGLYLGIVALSIASGGAFLVLASALAATGIGLGMAGESLQC